MSDTTSFHRSSRAHTFSPSLLDDDSYEGVEVTGLEQEDFSEVNLDEGSGEEEFDMPDSSMKLFVAGLSSPDSTGSPKRQ